MIRSCLLRIAIWAAAAVLGSAAKAEEAISRRIAWQWTEAEQAKIQGMLKKVTQDERGFWIYEEEAFSARTNLSARFTAETALYASCFVEVFPKIFSLPPHGKMLTKLAVTVYKTRAQYLAATSAPEWSAGIHSVDLYRPGWPVLNVSTYVFAEPTDSEADFCQHLKHGVLQHEATHAMLQKFAGRNYSIPPFINEGCASYFEAWDLRASKMTDEERAKRSFRSGHFGALVAKLRAEPGFRPSLTAYLHIDHERWGSGEISLNYALAESFIDFLLADRKRREIFKHIVERIYRRQPQVLDAEEIKSLEPQWHEHLAQCGSAVARNLVLGITDENGKPYGPSICEGLIATGQQVTIRGLPAGLTITPEELKACKNLDDVRALVKRKMTGR